MKKDKSVTINWKDLFEMDILLDPPKGYSSAKKIAEKVGQSLPTVREKLRIAREEGIVKFVRVKKSHGQVTWYYKD